MRKNRVTIGENEYSGRRSSMKINISGLEKKDFDIIEVTQNSYKEWRQFRKDSKENYFIIPTGLKDYLPYFYSKAMNLYLYYCLHSKNETGESWHSTDTISNFLNVSQRTINHWNNVLEKAGLIFRISNNRQSKSTFLLPISSYYVLKPELTLQECIANSQKEVDGELKAILHFFQWRKSKETEEYTKPYNTICCIFERTHEFSDKHFKIQKYVFVHTDIKHSIQTQAKDLKNDVYKIKSQDFNFKDSTDIKNIMNENVVIESFAIHPKFNLTEPARQTNLDLLSALNENLDKVRNINEID